MTKAKKSATAAEDKQVVEKKNTEIAVMSQLADLGGQGFETADKDAYAIPFLRILQSNSPQVNEDEEAYIEGAKAGIIFNTITGELYGKKLQIVPVHYGRSFIEWAPNRGGFVKDNGPDPKILERVVQVDDKNNSILDNGNIIQDTRNHYILLAEFPELGPLIMSMSSTGIKHSRKFMTIMSNLQLPNEGGKAPMFAGVWVLESILNKNDEGSWYGFGNKAKTCIEFHRFVDKKQLDAALQAREIVTSGDVKVDWESAMDNAKEINPDEVKPGQDNFDESPPDVVYDKDGNQVDPETGKPLPF